MVTLLKWWSVPLLLVTCGMAGAQALPPSAPAPATPRQQAASAPLPETDPGKTASPAIPAASLSPQQQRILDEADRLLDLAQKLKTEVDKTNQYTLSLNTLRRAEDIEKLAKNLQKQIQRENR